MIKLDNILNKKLFMKLFLKIAKYHIISEVSSEVSSELPPLHLETSQKYLEINL